MAFRVYFGIASLAILVLCVVNYWIELTPHGKAISGEYYDFRWPRRSKTPAKATQAAATPAKFVQIYNQQLGVADRCVICHLGMENPLMDGVPNPYKVHPGNLLASHPCQAVGCTICHQGQGLATTMDDAHGRVPHWDKPLLTGDFVQAACTKCHHEDEVPQAPGPFPRQAFAARAGLRRMPPHGRAHGGRKGRTRDWPSSAARSRGKWLNKWLINPKNYLPKGQMPQFHLRPQAANALAAYLATFQDKSIEAVPEPQGDHDAGAAIFRQSQCITCHVTREDAGGTPSAAPSVPTCGRWATRSTSVGWWPSSRTRTPFIRTPRCPASTSPTRRRRSGAVRHRRVGRLTTCWTRRRKSPSRRPIRKALIEQGKRSVRGARTVGVPRPDRGKEQAGRPRPDVRRQQGGARPGFRRCEGAAYASRFPVHETEVAQVAGQPLPPSAGRGSMPPLCGRTSSRRPLFSKSAAAARRTRPKNAWPGSLTGPRSRACWIAARYCPQVPTASKRPGWSGVLNEAGAADTAENARLPAERCRCRGPDHRLDEPERGAGRPGQLRSPQEDAR